MDEKIYECEVKKLFLRDGKKVEQWVVMSVADALKEGVSDFRCKDCHGAVKLHGPACGARSSAARGA
jgi:hypothetical protein